MSHDSSPIEVEVYSNGKTHRILKLLFFIYKCAGILLTSTLITQRVLATPTLIGTWFYEYHLCLNFTWTTHIHIYIYIYIHVDLAAVENLTVHSQWSFIHLTWTPPFSLESLEWTLTSGTVWRSTTSPGGGLHWPLTAVCMRHNSTSLHLITADVTCLSSKYLQWIKLDSDICQWNFSCK